MDAVAQAQEKFGELIQSEFARIEGMKQGNAVKDFSRLDHIVVGILPGDGAEGGTHHIYRGCQHQGVYGLCD